MPWKKETWVDDDGSLTTGTAYTAARMNNIETGIGGLIELLEKSGTGVVVHGSTANTARPSGYDIVIWMGTVEPEKGGTNDIWVNPEDFGVNSTLFVPTARVYRSTSLSVATGVVTPVTGFDGERWDIGGLHSTVTNTGRLTAPKAGVYTVSAHVAWEQAEILNPSFMAIRVNGGPVYAAQWTGAAFLTEQSTHTEVFLEAGDYVELLIFQQSGKTINTAGAGKSNYPFGLEMTMTWLGTGTPSLAPVDWGIVTELPSAPHIGDICKFKAAEGVYWNLVYTGEATYPWAKLGGPPLHIFNGASLEATTEAPQAKGIEVTSPLAMDAIIEYGTGRCVPAAGVFSRNTIFVNGGGVAEILAGSGTQDSLYGSVSGVAVAKGQKVENRLSRVSGSGNVSYIDAWLKVDPKRVG